METTRIKCDALATRPKTKGYYLPLQPNDDTDDMDSDDEDNEIILDNNDNFSLSRIPKRNQNGSAFKSEYNEINIMTNPADTEPEIQSDTETFDSQVHLHLDSEYEDEDECAIGTNRGPHIIVFSLICSPAIFMISIIVSGYVGLLSFLNILCYFFEERPLVHRIFICPIVIVFFPPLVVVFSLMLAVFSALEQISWFYDSWWESVSNLEKGFYSWLCDQLGLQNCCPYESIKLADDDDDDYESVSQDFESVPFGSTDV
ncbi:uncharacterized protein [Antedon mediterranea]|uniref:uncharacterized protein n=1 Tax=Antedon mediterranea TaxID=105859 RepID=UPI003AF99628